MKPILVLKALPKPWTSSFDTLADAQRALQQSGAVRVMSIGDAQNVESVPGRPSHAKFERMLTDGGAKSLMPGISRGKMHDRQAFEEGGLFTYRPNLQSFSPGVQVYHPEWDASFPRPVRRESDIPVESTGKEHPQVLVGTLENPEFHATPMEGRLQTEGFHPVGFDPEQTFLLSDPTKPFFRTEIPEAVERIVTNRTSEYAPGTYGYDTRVGRAIEAMSALPLTFEDPVSAQTGTWGKPRVVDDVFQYGEPMDIAMQLLKRDRIYDPESENEGQEGVDWHPGAEGVDWDSAVSSSLHPSHDLTQRHPFDYDMLEYDHYAQKLLNLMRNRDVAHLQNDENPMTEDEQFDLMDARQKLHASIPKNVHFPSIQNAVGYNKDGNKISTFGDGRPKFNEGSPRYQERLGDRPTVPIWTEGSFYGVPFNEETGFTRSEPMDIAFQLLKQSLELQPPMTQGVEEETPMVDVSMGGYKTPCECAEKVRDIVIGAIQHGNNMKSNFELSPQESIEYDEYMLNTFGRIEDWQTMSCEEILHWAESSPYSYYQEILEECQSGMNESDQMKYAGEPMEIAFQLLKERVSPEAKRHKLEYDKKYESSPERVKYREELNRERRRRGIYGSHDHKDISHTQGGKLTLEGEHENRARHFKDKGTLREL